MKLIRYICIYIGISIRINLVDICRSEHVFIQYYPDLTKASTL